MRLTRIYTKAGDKGATMLASGEFVPKDDLRIEAYGTVDELNAFVGCLRDELTLLNNKTLNELNTALKRIQNELFDVGGELSMPLDKLDTERQQIVKPTNVERLEKEMDVMNGALPPLENFVLPGGHKINSLTHVCRTVCRRAERNVVRLTGVAPVRPEMVMYLNRLSDWFFVSGRHVCATLKISEVVWEQRK